MRRFLAGVAVSEALALWVEFFYKFGMTSNVRGFLISIPFYFVLLCILHGIFLNLEGRRFHTAICALIGGVSGLMVEWFIVGNSPWQNPRAIQSGQFVFHAVYPILGYLVVRRPSEGRLQRRLLFYLGFFSVLTGLGFFMPHPAGFMWLLFLPLIAYWGLFFFVYRFAATKTQ